MVQVIQSNRTKPASFAQEVVGGLVKGGAEAYNQYKSGKQQVEENQALKEIYGVDLTGVRDPETRQALITQSLKGKQDYQKAIDVEKLKGRNARQKFSEDILQNRNILRDLEHQRNLPEGSLSAYESDPGMAERVTRPIKEPKKTQASQPIDPEQLEKIKRVRATPEYQNANPLQQYQMMTDAGVSKENAHSEADISSKQAELAQKGFESAYKAQEDFINDTTKSYRGFETEMKPRLLQMRNISDEDLVSPSAAVFLEHLGIPLGALNDPSSELYQKLSQDLLKGLPETYGNRILKVEVDNFLKTIPTLMNSPDGRRMIASNMLKLGELKEVYYNEMRKQQKEALDNQKPIPKDFQQRIFDQVKPQIDRVNNEFVKLSEVKSVPKNTIPFFNPSGDIEFVPKEHVQWAMENGGRRIW